MARINKTWMRAFGRETYSRSKQSDYGALAEIVASILKAAIAAHPGTFRLQQVQHRSKSPESLKKKLEDRNLESTATLEADIKDLAGCRLIFYTNSDVSGFLQTGIIQDNFDVDWDRTKIHYPVPGRSDPDNLFISNNYVVKLKADRASLPEYALLRRPRVRSTNSDHAQSRLVRNGARHTLQNAEP
jgi:hypothetical protein